jgi:hypothetical protein
VPLEIRSEEKVGDVTPWSHSTSSHHDLGRGVVYIPMPQ